jgi:hypothetical protein
MAPVPSQKCGLQFKAQFSKLVINLKKHEFRSLSKITTILIEVCYLGNKLCLAIVITQAMSLRHVFLTMASTGKTMKTINWRLLLMFLNILLQKYI